MAIFLYAWVFDIIPKGKCNQMANFGQIGLILTTQSVWVV